MSETFDTADKDSIVCPHCGFIEPESWDFETGRYDCTQCGKPYKLVAERVTRFTTWKVEEDSPQPAHRSGFEPHAGLSTGPVTTSAVSGHDGDNDSIKRED